MIVLVFNFILLLLLFRLPKVNIFAGIWEHFPVGPYLKSKPHLLPWFKKVSPAALV